MIKQMTSILTLLFIAVFVYTQLPLSGGVEGKIPAPTEIIQKKKDRKKFKQDRKNYYEQMHKTAPDDDWRKIDAETRRQKTKLKTELRRKLYEESPITEFDPIFRSRDFEGYWQEKGSNNLAGRIHTADIDFENDLIYCGSSGGNIWRGTIEGENWESLNDYMQLPNIIFLRVVENGTIRRVLIGTGHTRFYYTDNEGITIEEAAGLENVQNGGDIKRVVVKNNDGNTIYILASANNFGVGSNTVIYKSTDLGESFSPAWTGSQNSDRFDIWSPRYMENAPLYVQHNGEVSILEDNGELATVGTFEPGQIGGNRLTGGIENGIVFLYARCGEELWFSEDGGELWSEKNHPDTWLFAINSFNSSNLNPDIVAMGGIDVYRSQNGGDSWGLVNNWWEYYDDMEHSLHADIPEIRWFIDPTGNEFALISTDGGLYYANQNLTYVDNLSLDGLGVSQYYSTYTNTFEPYLIWAGAQDQGIQRSLNDDDGILDFVQLISGDYGHLSSSDGGQTLWFVYPGIVTYMTTPGNFHVSWNLQGSGYLWIPPLIEHPYEPNLSFLAGGSISGGNRIIQLTAHSNFIEAEDMPYSFNGTLSALAYSPIDPNHMYALTSSGYFYHSDNGGVDWELTTGFNGPDGNYLYGSTILPSKTQLGGVLVGGSGYSSPPVFTSDNHGESFESMSNGIPNTMVFALASAADDNLVFAATEVGPYIWQSATQEWEDMSGLGAPDQTYWSVEYVDYLNAARFGTYGRGIWDFVITSYSSVMAGDVNGDITINIQDIIMVLNFVLNQSNPDESQYEAADYNEDGFINISDIVLIINFILNN